MVKGQSLPAAMNRLKITAAALQYMYGVSVITFFNTADPLNVYRGTVSFLLWLPHPFDRECWLQGHVCAVGTRFTIHAGSYMYYALDGKQHNLTRRPKYYSTGHRSTSSANGCHSVSACRMSQCTRLVSTILEGQLLIISSSIY